MPAGWKGAWRRTASSHGRRFAIASAARCSGFWTGPPGRRVVVFTSGGPIGFAVQHALQAPPRSFLDVNWRIRNCSVTEFLFDRSRFTLDSFNGVSHLDDAALRTYR